MLKDGKIWIYIIVYIAFSASGNLQFCAGALGVTYLIHLFLVSSNVIAFREFTLVMYAVNYLLAPSILYNYNDADFMPYRMKLEPNEYFSIAIPGILALHAGIFLFPTKIFSTRFSFVKLQAILNEEIMKKWLIGGLILNISNTILPLPGELGFFLLLLSGLRYVGLFGLLTLNAEKYKWQITLVLAYEFFWAIRFAFFHDLMVWLIFFGLYFVFLKRIKLTQKIFGTVAFVLFAYVLQNFKSEYRNKLYIEEVGSYSVALEEAANSKLTNTDALFAEEQVAQTLIRVNQAWIAASTIDHTNETGEFVGTDLLLKYLEAAFLPRFLAPDKLTSGNKEIFNKYSGHKISQNTSMALGVVADGYLAFGSTGVIIYCFGLGLLFSIIFKIVERWGNISPFFVLLLFPILYYAVRPDCELQTTLGQLIKGAFCFWLVVRYYKGYFISREKVLRKIEALAEARNNARKQI